MIGKTRKSENHINRLMPTEMFDWKLKILILARTQVTDQALGGLAGILAQNVTEEPTIMVRNCCLSCDMI